MATPWMSLAGIPFPPAPGALGEGKPALAPLAEALRFEPPAPRVEFLEHRLEHRVTVGHPARLDRHGGGAVSELCREGALREIHAHTNDHCNGGREVGVHRRWPA